MDRLTAASVLLETVARGSISAAASHLEMSRAMATRYIRLMEEWAGARLLHRTTRRLSLTAAGEEILPVCKQILALSGDVSAFGNQAEDVPGIAKVDVFVNLRRVLFDGCADVISQAISCGFCRSANCRPHIESGGGRNRPGHSGD